MSRDATGSTNNSDLPSVTIVTPTFNRAEYLAETIESVLAQDYPHIQYVVLDDGSTDTTPDVLATYADRVHVERHPNMGEQRTVNRGFERATGDLIMVVNSDDPLRPEAVRSLVTEMLSHPELAAIYPDWDLIDASGETIRSVKCEDFDVRRLTIEHQCMIGPGAMFRRAAQATIGGRNPDYRFVADYDFWLRLSTTGPIRRLPRPLATWRQHAEGASHAHLGRGMAQEHVDVIRAFFESASLPSDLRRDRAAAMSWAYYAAAYHVGPNLPRRLFYAMRFVLTKPSNLRTWWRNMKAPSQGPRGLRRLARRLRGRNWDTP